MNTLVQSANLNQITTTLTVFTVSETTGTTTTTTTGTQPGVADGACLQIGACLPNLKT